MTACCVIDRRCETLQAKSELRFARQTRKVIYFMILTLDLGSLKSQEYHFSETVQELGMLFLGGMRGPGGRSAGGLLAHSPHSRCHQVSHTTYPFNTTKSLSSVFY